MALGLLVAACSTDEAAVRITTTGTGGAAGSVATTGGAGGGASGGNAGLGGTAGTGGAAGTGPGGAAGTGGAGGSGATAGTSGAAGTAGTDGGACQISWCDARVYACGDCVDNDQDGRTDAADALCLSACDNDEASFTLRFPGIDPGLCQDGCYFDPPVSPPLCGLHDRRCDPSYTGDAVCPYDPTLAACSTPVPQTCIDGCLPLTPGGCDCFGCCELRQEPGVFRFLGRDDPFCGPDNWSTCHPCQPEPTCFNACDACERCLGDDPLAPPVCP